MAKPKIHWYYGCCWGRACDLQCSADRFTKQVTDNPDWFCVTCANKARLALAAKSAPKRTVRCSITGCGSYAINPGQHGRTEGADLDLCDVCYWRKRAESTDSDRYAELRKLVEAWQLHTTGSSQALADWIHR